jgi:hypothetical protein
MLVELYARSYATSNGLVNGNDGMFKTSTWYHNTITWIFFQNPKTRMLTREKSIHLYIKNIQIDWTPSEQMIKNIIIGKNQFHRITSIQLLIQLTTRRTIH